jgi:hypothetical protein
MSVLDGTTGRWHITDSLTDTSSSYDLELSQVTSLEAAPLEDFNSNIVPIKYYILNDTAASITGNIHLNVYKSSDIAIKFNFKILGYVSFSGFALDTASINYQDLTPYEDNLQLSKPLPVNRAVLIEVYPFVESPVMPEGTYVTVYPKISNYDIVTPPSYFETPVEDLSALAAVLE